MQLTTLTRTNQATIQCPIFDVDIKVAACVVLREKVWRGERVMTRLGCQACMTSSKCPVASVITKMIYGSTDIDSDPLALDTPGQVKLPAAALEQVLPVVIMESALNRFNVPSAERMMIETANERIEKALASAGRSSRPSAKVSGTGHRTRAVLKTPEAAPVATSIPDKTARAAATGDLSAAINN